MIKKIIYRILSLAGLKFKPNENFIFQHILKLRAKKINIDKLLKDPLNSSLHLELAIRAYKMNRFFLALAELKTAEYLGLNKSFLEQYKTKFQEKIPELTTINHNLYFRLKSISDEINDRIATFDQDKCTILDVGGGDGILAAFLPNADYCLAEPTTNGINGQALPFTDNSFDLVVSCHVLEHIPVAERESFLDTLLAKSKKGVILLNPIHVTETYPKERIELVIDVTNAGWAKEHLECTLPAVEDLKRFSQKRNLKFHYSPNGSVTTSLALVFFDSLANNMDQNKYQMINQFYNSKYFNLLNSKDAPTAGLFYLEKQL
ncbi:MAG: class I SAM-dependent methyltransferase [Kiritimatiellae bacterium]|jgi:hypothetical protein|nr:class I SAM-dependent methyltransferase [Kiritimatiellia bacterium]